MKKTYYIFILSFWFIAFNTIEAQTQQALLNRTKHWRFGHKAGLDFNMTTGVPTVFNGSNGIVYEGNSCISDTLGNLLFYCTGDTVWNRNHQMMLNGAGMKSDKITILNSCIIPRPGNANQYYLFVNECVNNNCSGGKLYSSLIDMTLDGGNGGLVASEKNKVVMLQAYSGMAFTKHANGIDYWLAYAEYKNPPNQTQNTFIKITASGADTINRVNSIYDGGVFSRFSPNGTIFATEYKVYQFNNNNGSLTNEINLPTDSIGDFLPFSMEFSPNSNMLYYGLIYTGAFYPNLFQQFDLSVYTQTAITNSIYNFYDSYPNTSYRGLGHLQLAPNGKIYVARTGGFIDTLHVIHNPNAIGAACNFEYNAVGLNNRACNFSLPIYPDYYFNNIPLLTSVNEIDFSSDKNNVVFPNPCDDWLTINHKITDNYTYTLINQLGSVVNTFTGNQLQSKLNVSHLANGIYYLNIKSINNSVTKKIIINH